MAIWYEGNRNTEQNRREKDGVVYYVRGLMEVEGVRYERYGIIVLLLLSWFGLTGNLISNIIMAVYNGLFNLCF